MIVTNAGYDKITAALASGGKINIAQVAVGDGAGAAYIPTKDMTALKGEKWRGAADRVMRNSSNTDIVIVSATIPYSAGGFYVREIGVYDDAGTMIAVGNYPDSYKPVSDDGCSKDMVIECWFIVVDAADAINITADLSVVHATLEDLQSLVPKTRTINGHDLSVDFAFTKSDIGLGNVDNTADANKPVSAAQQAALNLKANLASPTFTGTVAAPTFSGTLTGTAAYANYSSHAVGLADFGLRGNYISNVAPSGGSDGDTWDQY